MAVKQKRFYKLSAVVSVLVLAVALVTFLTPAQTFATSTCGNTTTFFNWGCSSNSGGDQVTPLLITIVNWAAAGVTVAVIIGVIYGAIMFATSSGNQEQTKKAKEIIRNAVIALVLYFAMWSLMNFLVPGGLFN
jgi:uncharacterized membrane protein